MKAAKLQNFVMAQSVAAKGSASNPPGRGLSKVTWQKLRDNAMSKTEFYDISQQSKLLPELRTGSSVHPQLEAVDFYKEGRMSQDDYIPQTLRSHHERKDEHGSGYRKDIALDDILENFKEGQISFVGQAGSGKTTLMKAITRQFIEGKYQNLNSIEVVHFVHLRTFKRNDSVTPAELLFRNVTPEMSDAEMKEALQYAKENPDKVLFVIDSLDTVSYTIDGVYTGITTDDRASPEAILFHLLSGNLLPGCRFITSSREYAIRNYKGDVRAKQVIALAGLSEESMRNIVVGYVGEEEAEKKMTYLKRKPVIESLCVTPVWLIFTMMVLSIESNFTPTTMAGILVVLLQNMIRSEHVHERNIEVVVGKLAKMALTGTKERRVEFSLDELGNFNLSASEIRDLMVATPSGGYQKLILGDSILMFAHQCLQEILSAFHIAKMNLKEFKEFISKYINTPHYAVVRRLLAGILLNSEVFEEAENFLQDATDFAQKRLCLRKSLEGQLLKSDLSKADRLELYMCLSECGDGARDIIQNKVDRFDFSGMTLSSSEMYCIGWVMSLQTSVTKLALKNCNLTQPPLSALYHALECGNVQLDELDVSGNIFGPDEMMVIAQICKQRAVDRFRVSGCQFLPGALESFLFHSVGAKISLLHIDLCKLSQYSTPLGKIIKQCGVETLSVWQSYEREGIDLKVFRLFPDNFKISTLECRYERSHEDNDFIIDFSKSRCDTVRKFLPHVAKELILINYRVPSRMVKILQNRLDEGRSKGLKIIFKECDLDEGVEGVLECRKPPAENGPSIVENRRASLNNDGSITVSWHYPDEDPGVRYHVKTFCNNKPTGDIEICRDPYYQCKTPRPSKVHCFKIRVVDSNGIVGDAMFTNEVVSCPPPRQKKGTTTFQRFFSKTQRKAASRTDLLDENTLPGTSVDRDVPSQSEKGTEHDIAAGSIVRDERTQTMTKDLLDENTLPGTSVTRDVPSQSEKGTEQDIAAGSIVRDERTQTMTKGATGGQPSVIELPQLEFQYSPLSADKAVGPEGGNLSVDECSLTIRPKSLFDTRNLSISMWMNFQNLDLPADRIPVSPYLDVKFCGKLRIPAIARVPTWFRPSDDSEHGIKIYKRYRDEENKFVWCELQNEVTVHDEFIEFEVDHFCGFLAMRILNFIKDLIWEYKLMHGLFHLGENFQSAICYRTPESLFQQMVAHLEKLGYKEIHRSRFVMKSTKDIPVRMECFDPHLYEFHPQQHLLTPTYITSNESVQFCFLLHHLKEPQDAVKIKYIVNDLLAPFKVRLLDTKGAIVDAEEARRQAQPSKVPDPKLVLEGAKIRVSWDEVEDECVTYCIDLYCNGQKRNTEPYRTPATYIEFSQLEPSCEYRCEVWARNLHGVDGLKTWSNAVETGSVSQAARKQYTTDDRVREDVRRHDPSYQQRRIRDEASTSTNIGHHDQAPCEHQTIPKSAKSPSDLTLEDLEIQPTTPKEVAGSNLVKKIHPKRSRSLLKQIQPQMSRGPMGGRFVEETQQEYHPFAEVGGSVDPPHMSLQRESESSSETEEQLLPLDESEPAETSPMMTVAEIHPRQNFNSSNFDEPSTSSQLPPSAGGIMFSRQSEQVYYSGVEGSSYQGYRQMQMGFQGFPNNTTGSRHFGLGMGTAPRAIVDAEEARRQAPPPEIQEPKLLLERTKIRVSWDKVDDDRVTYCVNIYCNNQLINNTPLKTPKSEIEYLRLKPSCEYQCEVWTCNSRGFESAKTWSNAVNTPDTQECTPSEDGRRGGAILSQLVSGQGASITFQNSTINFGGKHQKRSPEENEKQGSSTSSTEQQTNSRAQEEREHQSRGLPESRRSEEDEKEEGEVQEGSSSSDRNPGDSTGN